MPKFINYILILLALSGFSPPPNCPQATGALNYSTITNAFSCNAALVSGGSCSAHNFLTSLSTLGATTCSQPACGDLSDSGTACTAVAPANTTSTTHQFFTAYTSATGAFTKAQPAFTDISGQATNAQLATQTANTLLGALTATTPSGQIVPSCSTSSCALQWTSGVGFGTNTAIAASTVTTNANLTGPITSSGNATSVAGAAAGSVYAGATPSFTATPTLGVNASTTGQLLFASGAGSGASVTVQNRSATGAYNFNLPATVGGVGQVLTSQGGGTADMTWASDNVGGGMFNYSDNGVTVTANTYYIPIGGGGIPQTTEASVDVPSPSATTVTNLQVGVSVAPGAGNSYTITLRDATADTALTCQISGAVATTCSDLTHSVNVAQNDLIDWKFVSAGTIITTPTVTISANNGTSNVGVTSIATNNGVTGGTIATTGTIGLASISNNNALCNNSGGSAAPTTANCTVTGTGNLVLGTSPTVTTPTLAGPTLSTYIASTNGTANSGTSYALSLDNGATQIITITGAVAITLTRTSATDSRVKFLQDGTGHVYSITGCKWVGGTAITYSTAPSKVDIVSIWYDGTNYNCMGGADFR